jgi:hypothetical protein
LDSATGLWEASGKTHSPQLKTAMQVNRQVNKMKKEITLTKALGYYTNQMYIVGYHDNPLELI